MKAGGDKEKQQRDDYDRRQGQQELKVMVPIATLIRWWKKAKTKVLEEAKRMKKILLVLLIMALVVTFGYKKADALTWCLGPSDCKEKSAYKINAMGEPTELPNIAILPSYTVGLNAIWLLEAKGLYSGPHANAAKLFNLATIQGQYAMAILSEEENPDDSTPNYYGINGVMTIADLITKFGGEPGEFILTFNPALGYTVGLKTAGKGLDHGPVINVVNADLEKLCRLVGLCK